MQEEAYSQRSLGHILLGTGQQSTPIRIYTVPKFLRAGTAIPNFNPVTQQPSKANPVHHHFQNQLRMMSEAKATGSSTSLAGDGGSINQNFPARLHFLLSELERDGQSDLAGTFPWSVRMIQGP
jgi:hypothetical protein